MTDADTNSLDMVDSDENIHFEDVIQHDIPSAGGFYKVFILKCLQHFININYLFLLFYRVALEK